MISIYISFTPYHVLVSCGLASLYDDSDDKRLIIVSDFADAKLFYEAINEWKANPFTQIILLSGRYNANNKINRVKNIRNNIKILTNFFATRINQKCKVFVFNDANQEAQIVVYLNSKKGGLNIYVEDGFVAYSNYIAPNRHFKKLMDKILYGTWYKHTRILGTYNHIDKIMVFHPEILRADLRRKEVIKIPREVLTNLNGQQFVSTLLKKYSISQRDLESDCLLIAPHSESEFLRKLGLELSKKLYSELVSLLADSFDSIIVKYHPREKRGDFLKLCKNRKVKLIKNSLPIEVLYLSVSKNPPKLIVGDISSSLLSSKIILKEVPVISILKIINSPEGENVFDVFNKFRVEMPSSLEEFKKILTRQG